MVVSMSKTVMTAMSCTDLMTTPVPEVNEREAMEIAHQVYDIEGSVMPLNGERDANFLVQSKRGAYVMKFVNSAENPGVTSFQTLALLHIERHGAHLPVPRVLATRTGKFEPKVSLREQTFTLRTVSYLDGISQNLGKPSATLMRELGTGSRPIRPCARWPRGSRRRSPGTS